MSELIIKPEHLKMLKEIFLSYCPKAEIWAFGSRVDGTAHSASDLDLVVKSFNQDGLSAWELRELLSDSNVPFLVDILEFNKLPESFQQEIEKNYIVIFRG